jgi:hypothetical protein
MFGFPTSPWLTIASYAGVFVVAAGLGGWGGYEIGYAKGQSEIQKLQKAQIDEQGARIKSLSDANAKLQAQMAKQHANDQKAFDDLKADFANASSAYAAAMKQLDKERKAKGALDPNMCVLSGAGRVLFDKAAGATDPGSAGSDHSAASGSSDGAATAGTEAPCVTLSQLQTGYLNLGQHDQIIFAKLTAFQGWARNSLEGGH